MSNYQPSTCQPEAPCGGKGRKNLYLCETCGHGFVSIDLDEGVAPFMSPCLNCAAMAHSMQYCAPQAMLADMTPAVEWYRPNSRAFARARPALKAHIEQGGLVARVVADGLKLSRSRRGKAKKPLFRV